MIQAMPKIELHVHLESTIDANKLERYAAKRGKKLPRPAAEFYNCTAEDLSNFLKFLDGICAMVGHDEDLEEVAYDCSMNFARDNILYAETILNPTHWPQLSLETIISTVSKGFCRGKQDGGADCRLLLSLDRGQSEKEALNLVNTMIAQNTEQLVGLSIDGNESICGSNNQRFASAYALAREHGFGLTAHAGESSGAQGVAEALDILNVDRIDHGVRCVEDATVLDRVVTCGVPLNLCLSSNLALLYSDADDHPLKALIAAGTKITLNRDDPTFLGGITLSQELKRCMDFADLTMDELHQMENTAIDAAFCDESTKIKLRESLQTNLIS